MPATRGSKKDSDRDITPVAEAVHVPASQAATPPSHSTLTGAELPQAKEGLRLGTQGPFGRVQLFATLWPVACQASLSGRGRSPGKNTGACWPILVPCPSRALYLLLPSLPTPLSTWCCQNPCNPSSCTTPTPGPHWGRAAIGKKSLAPMCAGSLG